MKQKEKFRFSNVCDMKFKQHMNLSHESIISYTCDLYAAKFTEQEELVIHMKSSHAT